MAENGRDISEQPKTAVDRENRLKSLKERQNEERQRKLEEIKTQALAAQRFKEEKENERRRRLDQLKGKEDVRRQQVEERKKAIYQAEQERLVSILKRNQEREARIEAKKRNEKSNNVFAFGSSTPRMLDPTDMTPPYFGHRRATSIQNITCSTAPTLTRRQSERDLDGGSKKRATSAGGLERSGESSTPLTPAGCASGYVGRRRTDLMPTIPSRDSLFSTSQRKSLNHSPGRAYSMTRLDQLAKPRKRTDILPAVVETSAYPFRPLSSSPIRQSSVTRSMSHLAIGKSHTSTHQHQHQTTIRRNLNKTDSRSMHQLSVDGPLLVPRMTRATQLRQQKLHASTNCNDASSRPGSSLSQQSTTSVASSASVRHRPSSSSSARRQRPVSIAITGVSSMDNRRSEVRPPLPKANKKVTKSEKSTPSKKASPIETSKTIVPDEPAPIVKAEEPVKVEETIATTMTAIATTVATTVDTVVTPSIQQQEETNEEKKDIDKKIEDTSLLVKEDELQNDSVEKKETDSNSEVDSNKIISEDGKDNEMTTSITKPRINTEEEAKAALAERRRLAREEAERLAKQERLRIEMEMQAELERQRKEEEQVQLLIEQQRAAEQERLEEAIKETQRREEEERLKREEEQRMKLLKEEAERRAREELERQKAEMEEKLKNEEKEREARRKRVEAIMLRTRGKNNANVNLPQQNSEDKNENKSENKVNGTKPPIEQENGTQNGKVLEIVDNIISDDSVKNANTVSIDTINSTDSLNSNNAWQTTQQYGIVNDNQNNL